MAQDKSFKKISERVFEISENIVVKNTVNLDELNDRITKKEQEIGNITREKDLILTNLQTELQQLKELKNNLEAL